LCRTYKSELPGNRHAYIALIEYEVHVTEHKNANFCYNLWRGKLVFLSEVLVQQIASERVFKIKKQSPVNYTLYERMKCILWPKTLPEVIGFDLPGHWSCAQLVLP
jgi:hypothetical protein